LLEALEDRLVPSNWFVSTLGSDGNPGSPAAPFATIQHAVNVAQGGDRIHVAQGTYGYVGADTIGDDARFQQPGNTGTLSGSFLHLNPAVVLVFDKSLQIYGGFNNDFTTWAPSTFRTYIDGGGVNRGVYVLDDNGAVGPGFANAALDMEGFTVQACRATGEPGLPAPENINAYGAGMWINAVARGAPTQGAFLLKNMAFRGNYARGSDTSANNLDGGSAYGAAVALRGVGNMTFDHVTFDTNLTQGGQVIFVGSTGYVGYVGGSAEGTVFLDRSSVHMDSGATLTFTNDKVAAGSGGNGSDPATKATADARGGGLAMVNSTATLQNVLALNNSVAGGHSQGTVGVVLGGTFYAENSTLNLVNADIRGGATYASTGAPLYPHFNWTGPTGGGGIAALNSSVSLNQVQVIKSTEGGGVWIKRSGTSSNLSVQIANTVVADNTVHPTQFNGMYPPNAVLNTAGGIYLQGVDAILNHTTVANNNYNGIVLIAGTNADGSTRAATATIRDSILANTPRGGVALEVSGSPNAVTLDHVLYAYNRKDDNTDSLPQTSDGQPNPPGTFNGLNTVIHAADAGFTSPGAPNYDYSIQASSPAVGQAVGSTAKTDIEGNPFTTPDLGAYAAPAEPRAHTAVALFDPETGIWQLRNSNAGGFFPDGPVFAYGSGGDHAKPLVGDWNGDGTATVGVVEVKALDFDGKPFLTDSKGNPIPVSVFELHNTNSSGTPDMIVPYGSFAATPVVGNWDNNPQHIDHIGVVEIQNRVAVWKLRNSFTRGAPDITLAYGGATSVPVVCDWNGDGVTTPGVVESVGGVLTWKLRNSFTPGAPDAGNFAYGLATAVPVTGDWNNDGTFTPGVYDPTAGLWQLRNENSGGAPDAGAFTFGPSVGSNFYAERLVPLAVTAHPTVTPPPPPLMPPPAFSFASPVAFATGKYPLFTLAADFNGDGKPDLAVLNEELNGPLSVPRTVSVLLNTTASGDATPSFAPQQAFATGSNSSCRMAVGDINGDGKPDLIFCNEFDNSVSVLLNTTPTGAATPSFAAPQTFPTGFSSVANGTSGSNPEALAVADINGDGKLDIITANVEGAASSVAVLLNTTATGASTATFTPPAQTFPTGSNPFSLAVGDINGDGKPDLIAVAFDENVVSVLLNTTASGAAAASFAPRQTFPTGQGPSYVAVGDVNGDGLPDLVVTNGTDSTMSVLLNTTASGATTAAFAPQQAFDTVGSPGAVVVADINGDGKPDIVGGSAGQTMWLLQNLTATGATTPLFTFPQTFNMSGGCNSVAVADVNGDGKPDLIACNPFSNTVSVFLSRIV
jgi:hypothetical protein